MALKKVCPVSKSKFKGNSGKKGKTPFLLGMKKRQLLLDNKKEDFAISKLEKDLKLSKKSACSSKSFCDDGLDYILEWCDNVLMKPKYNRISETVSQSLPLKNDSMVGIKRQKRAENRKREKTDNDNSVAYITKNVCVWRVDDTCQSDDMSSEITNFSDDSPKRKIVQEVEEMSAKTYTQKPEFEDCFTEKQLICLKRQVKGLLNRLAEANMHNVVMQMEALYLSNSRNIVNRVLVENIMTSLISTDRTPERLIQESVMLIAILHSNIDVSIGVYVVYTAIKEFHTLYQENGDNECKKLDNLIIFIAHLYTFKIVDDVLVYDVLNLLERFSEKDIELILSLLRNIGISLRKSNSMLLKELILKLQRKASEAEEIGNGSRVKYMIDIVLAIKNNNIQKIPNYDPDHIEHLKKLMKGFLHPGSSGTQIKFSYEDIIKAADHGHLLMNLTSGHISEQTIQSSLEEYDDRKSEVLSKLVKRHRMNTDVRRRIFSILVTSEDYLDAYEKILRLDLKAQQDCEVMNLIVHCALQGKTYNPFYQFLASKLCMFHRKYMLSLRCSVWDKLEQLNGFKKEQVSNLGQFVSHCIIEGGLPLSTLKVLDFSMMDQRMTAFLKDVMLSILMNSSSEAYEFICKRSTSAKHAVFRESLWLYVKHILCSAEVMGVCSDVNHLQQRLETMRNIFGL